MSSIIPYPHFGVLLVDDEPSYLRSLGILLERKGGINHIYQCSDSREVMSVLGDKPVGLVLLDLTMPHASGQELLAEINEHYPEVAVIIVSGLNNVDVAVECLKKGAFDYFVKTTEEDRLVEGIKRAIRVQEIKQENTSLSAGMLENVVKDPSNFEAIITQNPNMRAVFRYIESIANSTQPVLIIGENGTGKHLLANACHLSAYKQGKLVTISVANLDEQAFEETLFGQYQSGISGASSRRQGLIEQANNGTLFLDDICDLSLANQVKLLRLLQDGEYYPVNSERPQLLKARIVVATHRDLEDLRDQGLFRKDLYYRLSTHHIKVPPLRSRKQDIPMLLDYFIEQAARDLNKVLPNYPPELPVLLSNYNFPGNIRELRSLVFEAVGQHHSRLLSMEVFRKVMTPDKHSKQQTGFSSVSFNPDISLPSLANMGDTLIEEAMRRANNNQSLAARILGISQPALCKRLKKKREQSE